MMVQTDTKHTLSEASRMGRYIVPMLRLAGGDVLLCYSRVISGSGKRQASSKKVILQTSVDLASILLSATSYRRHIFLNLRKET